MRAACFVLCAVALASAGCSALIMSSGTDPAHLKTREDVRAAFGTPAQSIESECEPYDQFKTRRKISERWRGIYLAMGYATTLGFGEFLFFPCEAFAATRHWVVGQDIVVTYDADGNVTSMKRNGELVPWCGKIGRP
jgi:hypothetical protein